MTLSTGQILFNRYRIVSKLAQGGFGAIYRAWDPNLNRACAVKENFETSAQAQRQFEREAGFLAGLNHPNLPRVTDYFTIPGQGQYLVMDYVEGEDLQEKLDRTSSPLPENHVLSWIDQICAALTFLHNQNPPIIHRDIKPANIKITPDDRVLLVDFGIAKQSGGKTTLGARAVTPGYSPPEQYGQGTTAPCSDIYALGATLYTLLTGQIPIESIERTIGKPLPAPRQVNPGISIHIENVIQQAMQLVPANRFQSVQDFQAALSNTVWVSHSAVPPSVTSKVQSKTLITRAGPSWLGWGAVFLLVILLVALIGFIWNRWQEPAPKVVVVVESVIITQTATEVPTRTEITPKNLATLTPTKTLIPTVTNSPRPTFTASITLSPTPQLPPVLVEAYCDMFDESPVYVNQHQPVILWWRWDAKTTKQVQDHLDTSNYRILLDGQEITAERQSGIEYLSDKDWHRVSWYAKARVLSPGTHRAERYLSWDQKIFDGWDYYGPGSSIETEWDFCDIIVEGN